MTKGIYPSTHKTLLARIQAGDEISWQEFFNRYSPIILALCTRYHLPADETEDVRQDVMIKIFRNQLVLKYDATKARFRTYFDKIVRSCIVDHVRKKKQTEAEITCDSCPDVPQETETEFFLQEWQAQMLREALDQLRLHMAPQNFLAFHLQVFQDRKPKEVAEFLNMNVANVYLAKKRGTEKLQKIIGELNQEDSGIEIRWSPRK